MSTATSTFDALAWVQAVGAELGVGWWPEGSPLDPWNGRVNPECAYLTGPRGARLRVVGNGYRNEGRVSVSWAIDPDLTEHSRGRDVHREITITQTKTAKAAASDVARRALPGLLETVDALTETREAYDAKAARTHAYLTEVAELLGGRVQGPDRFGRSSRPEVAFGSYSDGGSVELYHDDTVELKVRMPREALQAVLQALGAARRPACDMVDGCGAAAGQSCEPGCPSLATDEAGL
jgi:hypothetical protein